FDIIAHYSASEEAVEAARHLIRNHTVRSQLPPPPPPPPLKVLGAPFWISDYKTRK
ncbi:MAG: hypothetical protein Q9203_005863, partial [Teloschistes exilis]